MKNFGFHEDLEVHYEAGMESFPLTAKLCLLQQKAEMDKVYFQGFWIKFTFKLLIFSKLLKFRRNTVKYTT